MARTKNRHDDDLYEWINGKPVLKDGARARVSLFDSDPLQRSVALNLHDGRGGAPGRRNGFAFTLDEYAKDELSIALFEYEQRICDAWRNPPTAGTGESEFIGAQEGDLCTINGAPGHLREQDGELVCVPDSKSSAGDHALTMNDIYSSYEENLRNQWRRP